MTWFRRPPSPPPPPEPPVSAEDVTLVYRLLLGRDPDAAGLETYTRLGRDAGLSLAQLIETLRSSDEYATRRRHERTEVATAENAPTAAADLIRPADVLARHTLQDLIDTAEEYYRRIPDATPLMSKPFTWWHEAPQTLQDLGVLLSGMHLGKSMTVLDFGGGTGWLSRILTQLNCQVICCDVSASALAIARRMFDTYPPIGTVPYRPVFLQFDGLTLDLRDASIDRIVCFDAFHHVPNVDRVMAELGRVLKPGGIAGFSEPGRWHSRSPQSQYEMRHHKVLENDIDLNAIAAVSRQHGFTSMTVKALIDRDLSLDDYNTIVDGPASSDGLHSALWDDIRNTMTNRSVFYLHKGARVRDSRSHDGLSHRLDLSNRSIRTPAGQPFSFVATATNTGNAVWLHRNSEIFGIVRLGTHLCTTEGDLLSLDFSRHNLRADVPPGDNIAVEAVITLDQPGTYRLQVDLVAEGVTWFENVGSVPAELSIVVD